MSNAVLSSFLRSAKNETTLADAWRAIGRDDLSGVESYAELAGAPVLQSFLYETKKRLAPRSPRQHPLKAFVLQFVEHLWPIDRERGKIPAPIFPAELWKLRPTKGWRRTSLRDASEVAAALVGPFGKRPLLREWPTANYRGTA